MEIESFELVEPFENDTLDFCLGVEWEMFRQRLKNVASFMVQIHRENAERLSRMCDRHKRFYEVHPCPLVEGFAADHFDDWREIVVGGPMP